MVNDIKKKKKTVDGGKPRKHNREREQKCWGWGGECTLRSSTQGGPQGEGDVGQRPEDGKGVSPADLWEAEGGAAAKVPTEEETWCV